MPNMKGDKHSFHRHQAAKEAQGLISLNEACIKYGCSFYFLEKNLSRIEHVRKGAKCRYLTPKGVYQLVQLLEQRDKCKPTT